MAGAARVDRFLAAVRRGMSVSVLKSELRTACTLDTAAVIELVRQGMLSLRDGQSVWLSAPGSGRFLTQLHSGRTALKRSIRAAKNREVLASTLATRKLRGSAGASRTTAARRRPFARHCSSKLGMQFHIADLVGLELAHSIPTPSGPLIRLVPTERG